MASLDTLAVGELMIGYGYEQLTVGTAAGGLTVPTKNGVRASRALITVETNAIRWRCDGTDPTAAVGSLTGTAPVEIVLTGPALGEFRAIRAGGADAVVSVAYFN